MSDNIKVGELKDLLLAEEKACVSMYPVGELTNLEKKVIDDLLAFPFLHYIEDGKVGLFLLDLEQATSENLEKLRLFVDSVADIYEKNNEEESFEVLSVLNSMIASFASLDYDSFDFHNNFLVKEKLIKLAKKGFLYLHAENESNNFQLAISSSLYISTMLSDLFEVLESFEGASKNPEDYLKLFKCLIGFFDLLAEVNSPEREFESNYAIDINSLTDEEFAFLVIESVKNRNVVDFEYAYNTVHIQSYSIVFNEYIQDQTANAGMLAYTAQDFVECIKKYLMESLHNALPFENQMVS